jgi:hypothetical protein
VKIRPETTRIKAKQYYAMESRIYALTGDDTKKYEFKRMLEFLTFNHGVAGSSPAGLTKPKMSAFAGFA